MSKWEMVKLGEVATLLNGRAYSQGELLREGKTPVLRVGNFFSNRDWYYSDLDLEENKYCNKGDLLYAWSASFGPRIWDGPKVIYHYHIWKIVTSNNIDKGYLFYLLQNSTNKIMEQGHGIAMIHVTKGEMEQMLIPLPPMEIQKKIAIVLNKAQELIDKRKKQIELLDEFLQNTFIEMFGDPVSNAKGWEFKKLSELIIKLGDGIHGTPEYSDDGEYYFINGNNLKNGSIVVYDTTKKVSYNEYKKYRKDLNLDTMLVSINGTLGNVAFYNNEKIILGKSACYFTLLNFVNKKYIYYVFRNKYFLTYATHSATGSTIKNVSLKAMREFPVPFPPIHVQNKFASIVEATEKQKALMEQSLVEMENNFNSIMQRAFRGELFN